MALAYGSFDELSHQLRFLLFEIGIGLPQSSIDYFITLAHQNTLKRLERSVLAEHLTRSPIISHHVHDFIDQLQTKLKQSEPASLFYQWNNLRDELDESIANEALTLAYRLRWNSQIRNEARSYDSLWSWIKDKYTANEALLFLEQWGSQGHPSHPCFRAKIGFTRREVLQNSAEFQAQIRLHWCALRKNRIAIASHHLDFKTSMALSFPDEFRLWQEQLTINHLPPEEYIPIPIHPWQWRNKLQSLYNQLIDDKSLFLLPHHQSVMPSMSEEVMMSINPSNTYIKLSLDIHTPYTSKDLNQEPSYQDDVALSQWVNSLLEQANHYHHTLFLVSEITSLKIHNPPSLSHYQQQVSVNLMQNPTNLIASGQRVVPLAGLLTLSPISNRPLLIEIIQASELDPIVYFKLYCRKVLLGQLHLLLKYGIAFATQHQNTFIIFTDDMPQGLMIRDHEIINVSYEECFENKEKLTLSPAPISKNSTISELNNCFIQGTLQNNIGYWIKILAQEHQLDGQQLWSIVRQVMHAILDELSKELSSPLLSQQKHLLLSGVWQHQCLLTMKLKGNTNKGIYIEQPNSLHIP